jgi:hypothetical protein
MNSLANAIIAGELLKTFKQNIKFYYEILLQSGTQGLGGLPLGIVQTSLLLQTKFLV